MKNIDTINEVVETIQAEIDKGEFKLPEELGADNIGVLIAYQLKYEEYATELRAFFGHSAVDTFFKGSTMSLPSHLASLIAFCIRPGDNGFTFIKELFAQALQRLGEMISEGKAPYSLCYRIVNVVIPDTLVLDETVNEKAFLRMVPESEVNRKYPINEIVGPLFLPHWSKHRMEAVFQYKGLPKDIERDMSITGGDYLEKLVTNAIILSRVAHKQLPYATHKHLVSPFLNVLSDEGFNGFTFKPKLLSAQEQEKVVRAYAVVKAAECDNVLHSAIDRFLVGVKQDFQHTNRVNVPNWDKVVDFAIACETLFLTVNNSSGEQELSYRFKLNGSSLLSKVVNTDRRILFTALAEFYKMRSKIVHGCKEKEIIKPANKFIKLLGIDNDQHKHDIGRLTLICGQLEEWMALIFDYITGMDIEERPYRKAGGWEDLLWESSYLENILKPSFVALNKE